MILGFYARSTPWATAIRLGTMHTGQAWADVPSHCAIILPDSVIEAVEGQGVIRRALASYDTDPAACRRVTVTLLHEPDAAAFARAQGGKPYDYMALAYDALGVALARLSVRDKTNSAWDCSRLCVWAMAAGGYPNAKTLIETRVPISPNGLLLAVTQAG